MLMSHRAVSRRAESRSELLEDLDSTLEWLCRRCPEEVRGRAAHEELVELRPRGQDAIEALEHIKEKRHLTEEETALRRAFRLLMAAQR
jgi:hypothetical protein